MLSILGILLVIASPSTAILTPPKPSTTLPCVENNLRFICSCDYSTKVLNVTSFLQQFNMHNSIHDITIQNCDKVFIFSNSLNNLRSLRNLNIVSVGDLVLSDIALNWTGYVQEYGGYEQPSLNILIRNTKVSRVSNNAFKGATATIKFEQSQFNNLESFALASLSRLSEISIKNCEIQNMHQQVFKGIQTQKFVIENSTFNIVPSIAFRDLDITENFTISNSRFNIIRSSAFSVKNTKFFTIINSYFNTLEAESFLVRTKGKVVIKNNTFIKLHERAFMGLSLIKETSTSIQDLQFSDNKVNDLRINFNRSSFTPRYGSIFLNQSCNCVEIQTWIQNHEMKEHIYCVNDTLRQTNIQADTFRKRVCETGTKTWVILVIVFSVLLVLLIVAIIGIVFAYRKYKKRKQKEYVNRGETKKGSVGLIVPDGRTYRETEVHVVIEKAELLTTEL